MSEPIPNQEGNIIPLNEEEREKLREYSGVVRSAMPHAIEAKRRGLLGEEPVEALRLTPFEDKALDLLTGLVTRGNPAGWSNEMLRDINKVLDEPLPADATESYQAVRDIAKKWIDKAVTQKEREIIAKKAAGESVEDEPGDVASFVYSGKRKEKPMPQVIMKGADQESMEEVRARIQRQNQEWIESNTRRLEEHKMREMERIKNGELTPAQKQKEERDLARASTYAAQIASDPSFADMFRSPEEIMEFAKEMHPIANRTEYEKIEPAETKEETDALPDYKDVKKFLIKELNDAGDDPAKTLPTWDEYGWGSSDLRTKIATRLMREQSLSADGAQSVMAAALLHGESADSFLKGYDSSLQRHDGFIGYLERINIAKNDDEVLSLMVPDPIERKRMYDRMMLDRPGSFEDTVWQMAHAPGTNQAFKEGKAMALYRNVVVKNKQTGRLECQQRVNTDMMAEWLYDRMMEAHGNNTTKGLDFENEVKIQKASMGLPISVYDMMLARTEEMFISQYQKDANGNDLRFGWVADLYEAVTNIMAENRNDGIEIPQRMRGDIQELKAQRLRKFIVSNMTRDIGGTSLSEQELKLSEKGNGRQEADGKMGAAVDTCYVAYCSAYDLGKLAGVLGYDNVLDLGMLFSLRSLEEARESTVARLVGPNKEKFREEFRDNPDSWLDLRESATINGVKVGDIYDMKTGVPKFLTASDAATRAKAEASFLKFVNFLNSMTPDERSVGIVKGIITKRAKELHGISDTINGASVTWRDNTIEMLADGKLYRFGMYFHLDNTRSGRSEEAKLNAGFRQHYNESYGSGGNIFNLEYFPHSMLPEALVLKNRNGEVYQNILEEAAITRAAISKAAVETAKSKYSEPEGRFIDDRLQQEYEKRIAKIQAVGSMPTRRDNPKDFEDIKAAARKEILNEEVSRILTASQAKDTASAKFASGQLAGKHGDRIKLIKSSGSMIGKTDAEIAELAKREVIADEEKEIWKVDPESKKAKITPYNEVAQKMQFKAEAERMAGTENYKNQFDFARELAFKTLGLAQCVTVTAEGPTVDLTKFIDSFSKRATEITKSLKEVNMGAYIDAWDDSIGPLDKKGFHKGEMRTMTIAEFMVGKPVLVAMGMYHEDGSINIEKVRATDNKTFAKWMVTALVAGEMRLFRDYARYNLSPRYSFAVTAGILEAIGRLPGGKDINGKWKDYFSKEQMDWIRGESETERFRLYRNEFLINFFFGSRGKKDGLLSGIAEALGIMLKGGFQGAVPG